MRANDQKPQDPRDIPSRPDVRRRVDAYGRVVSIDQLHAFDLDSRDTDPQTLADAYLQAHAAEFGVAPLIGLGPQPDGFRREEHTKLRRGVSKLDGPALAYGYAQFLNNIPVWGAGLDILVVPSGPRAHRVVGASNDVHFDLTYPIPGGLPVPEPQLADDGANPEGPYLPGRIDEGYLQDLIRVLPGYETLKVTQILDPRGMLVYYRYEPQKRVAPPLWQQSLFGPEPDKFAQPGGDGLKPALHYLATELHFLADQPLADNRLATAQYQVFVDVGKGRLLALRALVAACLALAFPPDGAAAAGWAHGNVLSLDPYTLLGPAAPPAPIMLADLDAHVDDVPLDNVSRATPGAALSDTDVAIVQLDSSGNVPPTSDPTGNFAATPSGSARAFSNVTAYYHFACLFRMLSQLNLATKYDLGELSLSVDDLDGVEMQGLTRGFIPGLQHDRVTFGQLHAGATPLSVGVDVRLVLHEFSHLLLYRSTTLRNLNAEGDVLGPGTLNLAFAHSFGDSLAAILTDPARQLWTQPEDDVRFSTFPWYEREYASPATHQPPDDARFHGSSRRGAGGGWAWGSARATYEASSSHPERQYAREQILSASLFRAYRALGGDSADQDHQLHAARYMAYLIMQACWLLPLHTAGAGTTPEDFVTRLGVADAADRYVAGPDSLKQNPLFGDLPGGAVAKLIAWAFEEQGLFMPSVPCGGRGPHGNGPDSGKGQLCDLYIGADRAGYLPYREGVFDTTDDLWNRQAQDGLSNFAHQDPVGGQTNYIYVRVHNRGASAITGATVDVYWRPLAAALQWVRPPGDWHQSARPAGMPGPVPGADAACAPGTAVFGPFAWTPDTAGSWVILASVSAADDRSTIDPASDLPCALHPIALERLLPYDNNLALRRLSVSAPRAERSVPAGEAARARPHRSGAGRRGRHRRGR